MTATPRELAHDLLMRIDRHVSCQGDIRDGISHDWVCDDVTDVFEQLDETGQSAITAIALTASQFDGRVKAAEEAERERCAEICLELYRESVSATPPYVNGPLKVAAARIRKKGLPEMIDPTCLFHGKKKSEHVCLYCSLCYKDLTPEECNLLPNGERESVCIPCAQKEASHET